MSKIRLVSLLIALGLAVFAMALPAAKPPLNCSQYNHGNCIYHWDGISCCSTSTSGCVWICI